MRELSLFSGGGGGLLASHLLGWETVGYVEKDEHCQQIIAARIRDGFLPDAPIFGCVDAFNNEGYADAYSGLVDVITAGFPCQPFSVAGKGFAENDERNKWPATIDTIRRVRPAFVLLENPPGLLARGYIRSIYGELAESGYDARWCCISAAQIGAPHKRDRWWCVAVRRSDASGDRRDWRDDKPQRQPECSRSTVTGTDGDREPLAHTDGAGRQGQRDGQQHAAGPAGLCGGTGSDENESVSGTVSWWDAEPALGRVANGVANRVDQLRALGNGQVPAVVVAAWMRLTALD